MIFLSRLVGVTLAILGGVGLALRIWKAGLSATWVDPAILPWLACLALGLGLSLGSMFGESGAAGRWLFRWRLARSVAVTCIVIVLLGSVMIFVEADTNRADLIGLAFVACLSGAVGFAELAQRYRDDPLRLLAADPTVLYVCINIAAGIGAFALVKEFGVFKDADHGPIYRVILASFGALAFFRSSLFTAKVGDADVDIGPSTLLKGLLETSDRQINRSQARDRADDAALIMRDVDFTKAKAALSAFCFTVVENITKQEQDGVAEQIKKLAAAEDISEEQRSIILGVYLMQKVGPLVLARAINALGATIRKTSPPQPRTPDGTTSQAPKPPVPPEQSRAAAERAAAARPPPVTPPVAPRPPGG